MVMTDVLAAHSELRLLKQILCNAPPHAQKVAINSLKIILLASEDARRPSTLETLRHLEADLHPPPPPPVVGVVSGDQRQWLGVGATLVSPRTPPTLSSKLLGPSYRRGRTWGRRGSCLPHLMRSSRFSASVAPLMKFRVCPSKICALTRA
jgi:hypothetical protein